MSTDVKKQKIFGWQYDVDMVEETIQNFLDEWGFSVRVKIFIAFFVERGCWVLSSTDSNEVQKEAIYWTLCSMFLRRKKTKIASRNFLETE